MDVEIETVEPLSDDTSGNDIRRWGKSCGWDAEAMDFVAADAEPFSFVVMRGGIGEFLVMHRNIGDHRLIHSNITVNRHGECIVRASGDGTTHGHANTFVAVLSAYLKYTEGRAVAGKEKPWYLKTGAADLEYERGA